MDWENERYVRVYTRDSADWVMLPWQARVVFYELLRKVDRAGVLEIGKQGLRGLAALLRLPDEVVEAGATSLFDDGCVVDKGDRVVMPNFLPAQESRQSDRARQRASRDRRLAESLERDPGDTRLAKGTITSPIVTSGHDGSPIVTSGHQRSPAVTSGHSSLAVPSSGAVAPEPPFRPDPPVLASPLPQTRAPAKSKREAKAEHELPGWDALKPGKRAALTKHLEAALRLWELQTELRAGGLKGLRRLSATAERLARVAERLETGMTEAEAVDALQRYADDAKRTGDWTWLNGETNWRAANCDRALGMAGSAPARASPGHGRGLTPQEILDLDMSESPFRLEGGGE